MPCLIDFRARIGTIFALIYTEVAAGLTSTVIVWLAELTASRSRWRSEDERRAGAVKITTTMSPQAWIVPRTIARQP